MTERVAIGGLQVAKPLHDLVQNTLLPGTGLEAAGWWTALEAIVTDLAPRNRELLAKRDALQAQIDAAAKGTACTACGAPCKDGRHDADAARASIRARMDLEARAKQVCGDSYDPTGKTDRAVRVDMLGKLGTTVTDAQSDDYVLARLDAALERQTPANEIAARMNRRDADASKAESIDPNALTRATWNR